MKLQPFGTNILVKPRAKDRIIGNTQKYKLYGDVIEVGSEVKIIKKGDVIGFTQWGTWKLEELPDGSTAFFIPEHTDFILCTIDE